MDMGRAIEAKLYYPALLVALTIPEICMGLALPQSQFVKEKHSVHFVDAYSQGGLGVNGLECFRLRGGVVHRADLRGHPLFDFSHVIFSTPESSVRTHNLEFRNSGKHAIVFDLQMFCEAMSAAARRWYADNATNPLVEENLKHLIRLCPNGLRPFVDGQPILASGE